jgi:hypothetical protein
MLRRSHDLLSQLLALHLQLLPIAGLTSIDLSDSFNSLFVALKSSFAQFGVGVFGHLPDDVQHFEGVLQLQSLVVALDIFGEETVREDSLEGRPELFALFEAEVAWLGAGVPSQWPEMS